MEEGRMKLTRDSITESGNSIFTVDVDAITVVGINDIIEKTDYLKFDYNVSTNELLVLSDVEEVEIYYYRN